MKDLRTKIVIYNGHTLGYIVPEDTSTLHVLRVDTSKGGVLELFPSNITINDNHSIVLASLQDYKAFRLNLYIFNDPKRFIFKQ